MAACGVARASMHCDAYPYRGPISSVMRCIPFFSFSRTTHKGVDSFSSSLLYNAFNFQGLAYRTGRTGSLQNEEALLDGASVCGR